MRRKRKRVLVHLIDPHPQSILPSIEGLLLCRGRYWRIGVPSLLVEAGAKHQELESREVVIPSERIAFYEVLH